MCVLCLFSKSAERWLLGLWLWRFLLLISADVWGSGVWATEQTVCGCFEWWPAGPCGWCVAVWVKKLLGNMLCPSDSSLSVCKAHPLTRYWTTCVVAHGLWTYTHKGDHMANFSFTQAHTLQLRCVRPASHLFHMHVWTLQLAVCPYFQ